MLYSNAILQGQRHWSTARRRRSTINSVLADESQTTIAASRLQEIASNVPVTRMLLLRHGQTDWNAESRIQGSSDRSRLTAKGIHQAKSAGLFLRDLNITKIFISPLNRAQQTFHCASETFTETGRQLPAPIVIDDLREIDLYEWQGLLKEEVKSLYPNEYAKWRGSRPSEFQVHSGHYPVKELWERARRVWNEVVSAIVVENVGTGEVQISSDSILCSSAGSTLVIGHNALNQALLCTFMGLNEDAFRQFEIPNCGLLEMEWQLRAAGPEAAGLAGEKAPCVWVKGAGVEARGLRWRNLYPSESEWRYVDPVPPAHARG